VEHNRYYLNCLMLICLLKSQKTLSNILHKIHLYDYQDETPKNCQIFLDDCDGMRAFMECIQLNKPEITRNMMGLLVSFICFSFFSFSDPLFTSFVIHLLIHSYK
jgi:hypothetical protein